MMKIMDLKSKTISENIDDKSAVQANIAPIFHSIRMLCIMVLRP